MLSGLSAQFRVNDCARGTGYWKVGGVSLSLKSHAAMTGCVGSVSGYGVQLDIFVSDQCLHECSIISIMFCVFFVCMLT